MCKGKFFTTFFLVSETLKNKSYTFADKSTLLSIMDDYHANNCINFILLR